MDDVRVAAYRAVFDEPLFDPVGLIEGNDDPLAAGWAGVRAFVGGSVMPFPTLLHARGILTEKSGRTLVMPLGIASQSSGTRGQNGPLFGDLQHCRFASQSPRAGAIAARIATFCRKPGTRAGCAGRFGFLPYLCRGPILTRALTALSLLKQFSHSRSEAIRCNLPCFHLIDQVHEHLPDYGSLFQAKFLRPSMQALTQRGM